MLNGKSISVCIVVHNRIDSILAVCKAWLAEPIDELFVVDCTCGGLDKVHWPKGIVHVRFSSDIGNKTRHAIALLTMGDYIIQPDDDVMPLPGFTQELMDGYSAVKEKGIIGVIGRTFHGSRYLGDTKFTRAGLIDAPVQVGFCGVVYFCNREYIAFDLRDMQNPYNDLYWLCETFPNAQKHVIPAKQFENLPSCNKGLFQNKIAGCKRQDYYEKLWNSFYFLTGRTF